MFSQSSAIGQGRLPDEGPVNGMGGLRALAAVANLVSLRDPRHAEELLMLARRPEEAR
jgi:hypothetical protein